MPIKVTATVPPNQIQDLISQIQETENLISHKISEIESFNKLILNFLFLAFFIISFLVILNFYFFFKWRRVFSLSKDLEKSKAIEKQKKTEPKIEESFFQPLPCKIKNCPFLRKNKICSFFEFREKLTDFSQDIFQSLGNNFLTAQTQKLAQKFHQSCYFEKNPLSKENLKILKKNLKKIRYFLNKVKKENKIPKQIKTKAKILWNLDHNLSQKIAKIIKKI